MIVTDRVFKLLVIPLLIISFISISAPVSAIDIGADACTDNMTISTPGNHTLTGCYNYIYIDADYVTLEHSIVDFETIYLTGNHTYFYNNTFTYQNYGLQASGNLQNVTLDSNNFTSGITHSVYFQNSYNVSDVVAIHNNFVDNLWVDSSDGRNYYFYNNTVASIHVEGENQTIISNTMTEGISSDISSDVTIANNTASFISITGYDATILNNTLTTGSITTFQAERVDIINNTLLTGSITADLNHGIIFNNTLYAASAGIGFGGHNISVSSNTVISNNIAIRIRESIELGGSVSLDDIIITNNYFSNQGLTENAVFLDHGAMGDNVSITGNTFVSLISGADYFGEYDNSYGLTQNTYIYADKIAPVITNYDRSFPVNTIQQNLVTIEDHSDLEQVDLYIDGTLYPVSPSLEFDIHDYVTFDQLGTYNVTIRVIDAFGNSAIEQSTVTIGEDTTEPLIVGFNTTLAYYNQSISQLPIEIWEPSQFSIDLAVNDSQFVSYTDEDTINGEYRSVIPMNWSLFTPGIYNITATGSDIHGNNAPNLYNAYNDLNYIILEILPETVKPNITSFHLSDGDASQNTIVVDFEAADNTIANFEIYLDGSLVHKQQFEQRIMSQYTIELEEFSGEQTFEVTLAIVDTSGNIVEETSQITVTWIDNADPVDPTADPELTTSTSDGGILNLKYVAAIQAVAIFALLRRKRRINGVQA